MTQCRRVWLVEFFCVLDDACRQQQVGEGWFKSGGSSGASDFDVDQTNSQEPEYSVHRS